MTELVGIKALGSATEADNRLREQRIGAAIRVGLLVLGGALLWHVYSLVDFALWAIYYPYELDYGEGLIWEQMRLMAEGRGYAPMNGFPAIAYPYPPAYHLASGAMAWMIGADGLAGGRAVSLASLLATAVFAGAIVYRIAAVELPKSAARLPAVAAGFILLSTWPVLFWSPLMRVDMMALCFSLGGVYFSLVALDRHRWVYAASLCFLIAVYTKQIMLGAPAASFLVLLFLRPKTAFAGIATCLVVGLALLGALEWATNGGVSRHLFMSNVSRVNLAQLSSIPVLLASHSIYVGLAGFALKEQIGVLAGHVRVGGGLSALRARLIEDRSVSMSLILIIYLGLATPMLFAIVKSGANLNYLIEWTNIVALFTGLSLIRVTKVLLPREAQGEAAKTAPIAAFTVAALVVQVFMLPTDRFELTWKLPPESESAKLSQLVRAATKPIISDDMVMLVRSGKGIYIEPAIIGEAGSLGLFDQRPILRDIHAGKFAFFITEGTRGDPTFDARYTRVAADAMDTAYPRKVEIGGRTVHLPAR